MRIMISKEKEGKRKNKKICGFNDIYIHQAVNVFHFTDDPNRVNLIINVMFWLLPRLMIITGTESYFLNSNPAGHCLDLQPLFRPSIRRFFLRLLLTAVYLAYIPKFIATQQTFDVFIPH